ncbi:MAG: hypothetical protein C0598_02525 [Marinilabiliales bacterium]|nr:MAG: hypothetical protein C0598_02525 [Marinilabiliales bacterium]
MNNRRILILFFSLITIISSVAQDVEISLQQTLGNQFHNFSYSILTLNDGGYILLADTETDTSSMDYFIIKVSPNGEIDWQKNYGGEGVERPSNIIADGDEGFYVIGSSSSNEGDFSNNYGLFDLWFARFNFAGKLLWHKNYGGSGIDNGIDVWQKENGNFIIGATTSSADEDVNHNNGMSDIWLFEISSEGEIIWEQTYGGSENEYLGGLLVDENDSIFLVGGTKSVDGDISFNHGEKDVWFLKTNAQGNLLREKTFGGSDSDDGKIIRKSHNNNLILTAITRSEDGDITKLFGLNDFWVLEVAKNSELIWQRSYGGSMNDAPKDMLVTDDGYLLGGTTYSFDGNITENKGRSDVWMLKIYPDGVMTWQKTFGGSGVESCTKIVYSKTYNYLTANNSDSFDFDVEDHIGETDLWMLDFCESFLTLDKIDVCMGDSIFWDGNYYSQAGNYSAQYISKCGLDSLKQLFLNTIEVPDLEFINGDDWVVELSLHDYSVPEYDNLVYYWSVENGIFKDTTYSNETSIQWLTSGNGNVMTYAIKKELCSTDTLELDVYVSGVGVQENGLSNLIIYPNPSSNGLFTIKGDYFEGFQIFNSVGMSLDLKTQNSNNSTVIDLSDKQKGIYFLKLSTGSKSIVRKLIYY